MAFYLVRNLQESDFDGLWHLAKQFNTVNLPANKRNFSLIFENAIASFYAQEPIAKRIFIFVAQEFPSGKIVGTSQLIARHGTQKMPHLYFQIRELQHKSPSLGIRQKHQVLILKKNTKGYTELGGLYLLKELRQSPYRLGLQLSFARFLFITCFRKLFKNQLIAELMPPLEKNKRSSALWNSLGKKATCLSYRQADHLSHSNKEFILNLFPKGPIYTYLLSKSAQNVLGKVGPSSQKAAELLKNLGFTHSNEIDPFDGGPHYHAQTDKLKLIKKCKPFSSRCIKIATDPHSIVNGPFGLLAKHNLSFGPQFFFHVSFGAIAQKQSKFNIYLDPFLQKFFVAQSQQSRYHLLPLENK